MGTYLAAPEVASNLHTALVAIKHALKQHKATALKYINNTKTSKNQTLKH